jgi:hypothetical protein
VHLRHLVHSRRRQNAVSTAGTPIDDGTDRAGAEALLASGSPLLYAAGAACTSIVRYLTARPRH